MEERTGVHTERQYALEQKPSAVPSENHIFIQYDGGVITYHENDSIVSKEYFLKKYPGFEQQFFITGIVRAGKRGIAG